MIMTMKKVILVAVISLVAILVLAAACVAALSDPPSEPVGQGVESQVPVAVDLPQEPTESPAVTSAPVMTTQGGSTLNDNEVYVLSEPLRLQKGTIGGDKYFCSMVTMENKSSDAVSYNIFYWKLKNPEGFEANMSVFGSENLLGSGDLVPGDKVKGDVCFNFDSLASGQYTLSLNSMWGTGPEMTWKHQVG